MFKIRRDAAAVAVLALMCVTALPAPAQVPFNALDQQLEAQMKDKKSGDVLSNQKLITGNIDTRISQLRGQISIAMSRKWLTPGQAAQLSAQLDTVQGMETRDRQVGLTAGETEDLVSRIRTVAQNINSELASTAANKGESIKATPVSNLENERLFLSNRIEQGIRLGRLSPQQVKTLRNDLDYITNLEKQPGGLTPEDQARLRKMMAGLNSRINHWM